MYNVVFENQGDSDMLVEIDKQTYASEDVLLVKSDNEAMPEELFVDTIMPSILLQPPEVTIYKATKDWSEYTPRMLKSTKHKALKLKRKAVDNDDLKSKLVKLKIELLEREEKRKERIC
ncbi:hypothetical protein FQA39_LY17930 [Lamprigera yunnana]|nr:hypothetical protein FQA39_LY17930 [Lamprigera yunnana]